LAVLEQAQRARDFKHARDTLQRHHRRLRKTTRTRRASGRPGRRSYALLGDGMDLKSRAFNLVVTEAA
jgi:hypothetical protein